MPDDTATRYEIDDAAADFARLVERVEQGEEIIILRDGVPVAKIVAVDRRAPPV